MTRRASAGPLVPVLIVAGLIAVLGGAKVMSSIEGMFAGHDPVIVGSGDVAVLVAREAEGKIKGCAASQLLTEKKCGNLKVVVLSAARMPYITRNISLAWSEGHQFILTKDAANRNANYTANCRKNFVKKYPDGSCDEYEFASTAQGKTGARVEEVPSREQNCQGGTLSTSYRYQQIIDGDDFLVAISQPDKIAKGTYEGQDVAEDQSCGS